LFVGELERVDLEAISLAPPMNASLDLHRSDVVVIG